MHAHTSLSTAVLRSLPEPFSPAALSWTWLAPTSGTRVTSWGHHVSRGPPGGFDPHLRGLSRKTPSQPAILLYMSQTWPIPHMPHIHIELALIPHPGPTTHHLSAGTHLLPILPHLVLLPLASHPQGHTSWHSAADTAAPPSINPSPHAHCLLMPVGVHSYGVLHMSTDSMLPKRGRTPLCPHATLQSHSEK